MGHYETSNTGSMTTQEAATKWGYKSPVSVVQLCIDGRVPGAVLSRGWQIPANTAKPTTRKRGPKGKKPTSD